ncbi:filamentous hemagglutinin N-terminal domain-containing protein [Chroococcus sp. FPU101]|uniref:two-partner secretion domain-containing protein n=1 Tax=Chroococcus sp. FPU101 TaxID=1974212 RepID=UPI001A8FC025|nr:filamentous hemagglutinin N-terminal domain-containing protein [Chroococcus sp. FPU101]GFE70792.1 hypothetical protein CFPU101_34020 [Chroococcus sp. FPU101]
MEPKKYSFQSKNLVLLIFLLLIESLFSRPIQAQVIPDSTLGNEKSSVNQIDALNERIDGGARRGGNLFHSFQEFNINQGNGVYFANPQGIMNIFSRVTGGNASQILGRLGVLGQSNLFFLNPYGIIFGPNSSLDIRGSFVSSTANAVKFADETVFSAINPQSNALLTISVPIGLQTGNLESTLSNRGNLVVGKDFTLSAGNLDLQGQIIAGGNLSLEAFNTLLITDSITNPFVAFAGGQLIAQGNQLVKISILNHPNSGLFSGGDLILRSDFPIAGDAHYSSGGSFRIEKLDGSLGSLSSNNDPVIRASGDVSLDSYSGVSLHIFAGGSVTIPGTVLITEVENVENSITETVTLSNGTTVVIDGSAEPTLDIRAGTLAVGNAIDTGTPTSADISIGEIYTDVVNGTGGQVFLTNQYQPNTALSSINGITIGAIDTRDVHGGGYLVIDARGGINLTGQVNVSALDLSDSDVLSYLGNGGDVRLLSQGDIVLSVDSGINSNGLLGGNILLSSNEAISITEGFIRSNTYTEVANTTGGDIIITAKTISLIDGASVATNTLGKGNSGAIKLTASDTISLTGENSHVSNIASQVALTAEGNSGGIEITTGSLSLTDGAVVDASTFGKGNAGAIRITASDTISTMGEDSQGLGSGIFSTVGSTAEGNSGGIEIFTGSFSLTDGAVVNASTFGKGNAGAIRITASDTISAVGEDSKRFASGIFSQVAPTAEGNSGGIEITTGSLSLIDGAVVDASTFGRGNAGAIKITASDAISAVGERSNGFVSGIFIQVGSAGEGNSGGIEITTGSLFLSDGGVVSASTLGKGNSGAVRITATETISAVGEDNQGLDGGIFNRVASTGEGNSGGIEITTGSLFLSDGGVVSASTLGKGNSGAVRITATETISITGKDSESDDSGVYSQVRTSTAEGDAGGIEITTNSLFLTDKATISAKTLGIGTAGNITITANTLESTDGSQIQTNTETNFDAGDITLNIADTLTLSNSSLIAQTTGEGKAGNITINTPQLNLTQGAIITAQTSASGNGGSITVNAPISLTLGENSQLNVETSNVGQAGNIEITSHTVTIEKNAEISATATETATNTTGGGSITINASNLNLSGKLGIFAETQGQSPAGNLTLKPDGNQPNLNIQFTDTALISARTTNQGTGGSINIRSPQIINIAGEGKITVETTGSGLAGNINITTEQLNIGNQTEITASTTGTNNAGSINLNANQINLQGAIINAYTNGLGSAGSINLSYQGNNANRINLDHSTISTEIRQNAQLNPNIEATPSNISIYADTITLTNNSLLSARTEANLAAGSVNINSNTLNLSQNSQIETLTQSSANAGSITINANEQITITNANSGLFAQTSSSGQAGNIIINSLQFTLADGAKIQASTSGGGNGGSIIVNAPISVILGENSQLNVETSDAGKAGNIEITSHTVTIGKDAQISATATNTATNTSDGGSININASNLNIAGKLGIFAETQSQAPAGTLTLNPDNTNPNLNIRFIEQGLISASTSASGNGGNINISAPNHIDLRGIGTIATSTSGTGNAGTINLTTNQLSLTSGVTVTASTTGTGNAGDINLDANQINLQQATVTALTNGGGNAGSINIPNAQTINLNNSRISTEIQAQGTATKPSNITLTSKTLTLDNSSISASTDGTGNAGEITLINQQLELNNSFVNAISTGVGNAGSISLPSTQHLSLNQSVISVSTTAEGNAGSITVPTAQNISLNQSKITASTSGVGDTGIINLTGTENITLTNNSEISNAVLTNGTGNAQTITLKTPQLSLHNSSISSSTDGTGNAGSITVPDAQMITLDNSTISTEIQEKGVATQASNITLKTNTLNLNNSNITASSIGTGDAGNLTIRVQNSLTSNNSTISTSAEQASGGNITVSAQDIRLRNDSDLRTNVSTGAGGGGDITLTADSILAFNDSDILASAKDGIGGNISLNTPVFFGSGYILTDETQNPDTLENNNRVDINASGAVSGVISVPDLTFIQNSLFELPETLINTENLIASSCVVPNQQQTGTFILTGAEGLPTRPNNNLSSPYPTGTVETIPKSSLPKIDEPQGFYRLSNGMMVLSKKCN